MYSLQYDPDRVVDFLVTDRRLSHSILYGLGKIAEALTAVSSSQLPAEGAWRELDDLTDCIEVDWCSRTYMIPETRRRLLAELRRSGRSLHDRIVSTFFDYSIEDAPVQ